MAWDEHRQDEASALPFFLRLLVYLFFFGTIAAIAIPNLLRSRSHPSYIMAIGSMKTIFAAQVDYHNSYQRGYAAELQTLAGEPRGVAFLDPYLGSGFKMGYSFLLVPGCFDQNRSAYWCWSAAAFPMYGDPRTQPSLYVDQSGVVRIERVAGLPGIIEMPDMEKSRDAGYRSERAEGLGKILHELKLKGLWPAPEMQRERELTRLAHKRFPGWTPPPTHTPYPYTPRSSPTPHAATATLAAPTPPQ